MNYRNVLILVAIATVVVFVTIHGLMRTNFHGEEYSPLEDYNKTIDILWALTTSIERKTELKPVVIHDLNIVSESLSRYRDEAMYKTGLSYREFYTIDTYVNVTRANKEMVTVSHTLPSTWSKIVESVDLLGGSNVVEALEIYREIRTSIIYIISKLNVSENILRETSYREYAVRESHIAKIDEARRVINETITLLNEYVKLMEIIERARIEVSRGGNVTEITMKMIEEIKNRVDVSQIEKLSPAIHDFIEKASRDPENLAIEREVHDSVITHTGSKSGGYGEEFYDD